jgi:peptidoglycan/xylan/chitin deacetylase (PgdA/CDA1 family)
MHILSIAFDDGFRRSTERTAALFEKRGLQAEFYVLAEPRGTGFGDFALWNALAERGHSIQPHGCDHTNKASLPLAQAQDRIQRCLDLFAQHLAGFQTERAIFGYPYNASTPELDAWLPTQVRACRTGGPTRNPLPTSATTRLTTNGWEDAEPWLVRSIDDLLAHDTGWVIYNAHGLDGEGWGPLRTEFLEQQLDRLLTISDIEILPIRDVLARIDRP